MLMITFLAHLDPPFQRGRPICAAAPTFIQLAQARVDLGAVC